MFGRKAVSNARFRAQMSGPGGIRFKFSPKLQHENPQIVNLLAVIRSPDFFQQLSMRHDLVCMANQNLEQLVLDSGEMNLRPVDDNAPLAQIDFDITRPENRRQCLAACISDPSQRRT